MSVEFARRKAQDTIFEIGRGALHAIAPNDFEYYACTFELINSEGVIEDIFHFPIMPSGISVGRQSLLSIKKTGLAYLSQFNDSYVGRSISINGTFGRKFRLLITKGIGGNINDENSIYKNFDLNVKTGYGALKLLENIISQSQVLDEYGQPKLLILYNSTLNHNNVIEVISFNMQQSLENNMMWNYTMEIKSLANIDDFIFGTNSKRHLYSLLAISVINKSINKVFDNISLEGVQKTVKDLF